MQSGVADGEERNTGHVPTRSGSCPVATAVAGDSSLFRHGICAFDGNREDGAVRVAQTVMTDRPVQESTPSGVLAGADDQQ